MLKKSFFVAALLACVSAFALNGKLFFTLSPSVPDEFAHIMPYRPPHVPFVGKCVRNQPVMLHLVLANPAVGKDGKVLVEIESIKSIDPNGKTKELVKPGKPLVALQGVKKSKRDFFGVMLSGLGMTMVAEDGDPLGKTRMTVKLRDRGDDSTLELAAEIELVEKLPGEPDKPMTVAEMSKFLVGYYLKPDPAKIQAAFAAFMRLDSEKFGVDKTYNPLMWLCGFAELYKLNPQLRPALVKCAAEYPGVRKQYIALILAEAGAKDDELKDADPELRKMFDKVKGKHPLSFREVTAPTQLDALWMEFLVTGRFEPIRRLVGELRKRDGAMTLDEVKKLGRKPTGEEMEKAMPALIGHAAEWSLASNAGQHKLVGYYLESILMRKQYPDDAAAVKIGVMLVKAGLMEFFDKQGGGKGLRPVLKPKKKRSEPGRGGKYEPPGK